MCCTTPLPLGKLPPARRSGLRQACRGWRAQHRQRSNRKGHQTNGHVDDYSVYLVQELLVGGTLQALLEARGPLDEDEAAAAIRGALDAVDACHLEGIVYGEP
ncbi:hypothetical protein Rsub_11856 [Raphidocelis subcapitata]|uniref:Protein kinase domain-containing protein n=1 Tax=Raphidocelis subcapitata TaxID=307507 RepID=A0A2V0PPH6_9CHLO|nr:hypothetical protein Rsub_11856 [Raphidocelis subcapitata]|eukprot:GBF99085.1 hypothetical protein Rsub_11856 [Raphidocelis subcapitata]